MTGIYRCLMAGALCASLMPLPRTADAAAPGRLLLPREREAFSAQALAASVLQVQAPLATAPAVLVRQEMARGEINAANTHDVVELSRALAEQGAVADAIETLEVMLDAPWNGSLYDMAVVLDLLDRHRPIDQKSQALFGKAIIITSHLWGQAGPLNQVQVRSLRLFSQGALALGKFDDVEFAAAKACHLLPNDEKLVNDPFYVREAVLLYDFRASAIARRWYELQKKEPSPYPWQIVLPHLAKAAEFAEHLPLEEHPSNRKVKAIVLSELAFAKIQKHAQVRGSKKSELLEARRLLNVSIAIERTPAAVMSQASVAVALKEYRQAVALYREIAAHDNRLFGLGGVAIYTVKCRDVTTAQAALAELLAQEPESPIADYVHGLMLMQGTPWGPHDYKAALTHLERALSNESFIETIGDYGERFNVLSDIFIAAVHSGQFKKAADFVVMTLENPLMTDRFAETIAEHWPAAQTQCLLDSMRRLPRGSTSETCINRLAQAFSARPGSKKMADALRQKAKQVVAPVAPSQNFVFTQKSIPTHSPQQTGSLIPNMNGKKPMDLPLVKTSLAPTEAAKDPVVEAMGKTKHLQNESQSLAGEALIANLRQSLEIWEKAWPTISKTIVKQGDEKFIALITPRRSLEQATLYEDEQRCHQTAAQWDNAKELNTWAICLGSIGGLHFRLASELPPGAERRESLEKAYLCFRLVRLGAGSTPYVDPEIRLNARINELQIASTIRPPASLEPLAAEAVEFAVMVRNTAETGVALPKTVAASKFNSELQHSSQKSPTYFRGSEAMARYHYAMAMNEADRDPQRVADEFVQAIHLGAGLTPSQRVRGLLIAAVSYYLANFNDAALLKKAEQLTIDAYQSGQPEHWNAYAVINRSRIQVRLGLLERNWSAVDSALQTAIDAARSLTPIAKTPETAGEELGLLHGLAGEIAMHRHDWPRAVRSWNEAAQEWPEGAAYLTPIAQAVAMADRGDARGATTAWQAAETAWAQLPVLARHHFLEIPALVHEAAQEATQIHRNLWRSVLVAAYGAALLEEPWVEALMQQLPAWTSSEINATFAGIHRPEGIAALLIDLVQDAALKRPLIDRLPLARLVLRDVSQEEFVLAAAKKESLPKDDIDFLLRHFDAWILGADPHGWATHGLATDDGYRMSAIASGLLNHNRLPLWLGRQDRRKMAQTIDTLTEGLKLDDVAALTPIVDQVWNEAQAFEMSLAAWGQARLYVRVRLAVHTVAKRFADGGRGPLVLRTASDAFDMVLEHAALADNGVRAFTYTLRAALLMHWGHTMQGAWAWAAFDQNENLPMARYAEMAAMPEVSDLLQRYVAALSENDTARAQPLSAALAASENGILVTPALRGLKIDEAGWHMAWQRFFLRYRSDPTADYPVEQLREVMATVFEGIFRRYYQELILQLERLISDQRGVDQQQLIEQAAAHTVVALRAQA